LNWDWCTVESGIVETRVRCPYCVWQNEFRPMVRHLDGAFICTQVVTRCVLSVRITSDTAGDALD